MRSLQRSCRTPTRIHKVTIVLAYGCFEVNCVFEAHCFIVLWLLRICGQSERWGTGLRHCWPAAQLSGEQRQHWGDLPHLPAQNHAHLLQVWLQSPPTQSGPPGRVQGLRIYRHVGFYIAMEVGSCKVKNVSALGCYFSDVSLKWCSVWARPGRERRRGQRCDHGSLLQVHLRQGSHRPYPYLCHPLPHLPPRPALPLVSGPWPDAYEPPAGQHPARWPARAGRQLGTWKAAHKDTSQL